VIAVIESSDVKVLLAAVGGLLVLIFGFIAQLLRIVKTTLQPNGGTPDSKSLFDKITTLQDTVDDRFRSIDRQLHNHDDRIKWLEDHRKGGPNAAS
jgi:hypothetical protein